MMSCLLLYSRKTILIEPIFAQWIQSAHGKTSYGLDVLLTSTSGPAFNTGRSIWLPGWLTVAWRLFGSLCYCSSLHTTTLILVKGALDARGSKLMPDKKDFGYSFPCDGPGRGGTCDIWLGTHFIWQFLDVKYHWLGYLLLALETHHIMAG
ncbi:hypothetical protein RDABS01_031546 [Bienertia sinuspersici]